MCFVKGGERKNRSPERAKRGVGEKKSSQKNCFRKKAEHEDSNIFFVLVYRRLGSVGFGMFDLG